MTRLVDFEEKVGTWSRAFDAVRRELTPDAMREKLATMDEVDGATQLGAYMTLATQVMANDRIAAQVAASLIQYGLRPSEDV